MRSLITGACGFVGNYLVRHILECGDEVLATYASREQLDHSTNSGPGLRKEILDLVKKDDCLRVVNSFKPDVVYHLAGISFVPEAEENFERALNINVNASCLLAKACAEVGKGTRFLYVSSAEVYGRIEPKDLPVTEETPIRPANNYSLSKAMAEMGLSRIAREGGIELIIARPFNHIGPGQNDRFVASNFAHQLAKIKRGQAEPRIQVGNLEAKRDFMDVRDVIRAYRLAALKGSGIYNLSSGKSISIRYILDTLIEISGMEVKVEIDKSRVRPLEVPEVYGNYLRAEKDLGWKPSYEIRQTLEAIYNSALDEL